MIILKGPFEQFHLQENIRRHRNRNDPIRVIKGFYLTLRSQVGHSSQPEPVKKNLKHQVGVCTSGEVGNEASNVRSEGITHCGCVLFHVGELQDWAPSCQ